MRFSIDDDTPPGIISGWITPDDPRVICRVAVTVEGRRVVEVEAKDFVPALRENGWHSTGQCRFRVDETHIQGLAEVQDLEVHDIDSNVLVYRRTSAPGQCQGKLLLLNTSIHPESALQAALFPHFRYNYFGIGKFSEQEMVNVLHPVELKSLFVSGNFVFPRYEVHISNGQLTTAMLLHDPYVEMANRLIWLRDRAGIGLDPVQRWRLGALAEAAAFAKGYDYADVKHLKRFLRMLPLGAYRLLYNPLTRMLGTYLPEDQMVPLHSVVAVEVLARIGVVGHYDYFEAFVTTVYDHLGIDAAIPAPVPVPEETRALATRLQSIKAARDFVVFDVAISDGVRRSVARNWAS